MGAAHRIGAKLVFALSVVLSVFAATNAFGGTDSYSYDPLGRLIRWVDSQGRATEYVYDAVGNILSVTNSAVQQAPTVATISPASVRRGETRGVTITGTNLANVTLTPSVAGLSISGLTTAPTQVTFSLAVAGTVPLGPAVLVLSNGQASANATIVIEPRLPVMLVQPVPLAIPPDNVARNFALLLDAADTVEHVVSVQVEPASVATISPASVTFAAGETSKTLQVVGKLGGQAVASFTSPTLAAFSTPVFVTAEFQGITTAFSPVVGVQVGDAVVAPGIDGTLASQAIGVVVGTYVSGLSPNRAQIGTTRSVSFLGGGIPPGVVAGIDPGTGVTLGPVEVAADGSQATLQVTVAADAPTTTRRLYLSASGAALPLAGPNADQFRIVTPVPEISSISPINGTAGSTISVFTVRGDNLAGATGITFVGGGVTAGSSPQASADGKTLTTSVTISPVAPPGPRTVVVNSLAGDSDATPTAANTFNVVSEIQASYAPLVSPIVGISVAEAPAAPASVGLASQGVGVVVGNAVTAVTPKSGAQGESLSLSLSGQGFVAPATVTLTPSTGLTVGSATVSPDGATISVPVVVATDALLGVRAITATSGGTALPFASPALAQFLVTAPVPQVQSINPNTIAIGGGVATVTIRGANFQGIQQVRISPPDGVSVGTPAANAAGDTVTVGMSAAAGTVAGPRVVTVVTPAGESSSGISAANTMNFVSGAVSTISPLLSPLVGLQVGADGGGTSFAALIGSPLVGLQVGTDAAPVTTVGLNSLPVGLAIGPVATAISPRGLVRGTTTTFTVSGVSLPADATIGFSPATGLTIGATQVSADGLTASTAVTPAADAVLGTRGVTLATTAIPPAVIPFVPGYLPLAYVNPGAPNVVSLTPILAKQGETFALTIRGANFNDLVAVTIEPPEGVDFSTAPVVSADKAQIDLNVHIAPDAALGSRVIRVTTLGGQSSATASPANTFTIFAP